MVHVLKEEYFSKADSFILPLTGLPKTSIFTVRSFLFWEENSIEDFKLAVTYAYTDKQMFQGYCKQSVFPILDKNGYLIESYDFEKQSILIYATEDHKKVLKEKLDFDYLTVFVLDLSEWAMDITMFLAGRYSKLSKKAKSMADAFHTYFRKGQEKFPIHIEAILYPNNIIEAVNKKDEPILGKLTPIEYVAKNYGLSLTDLQEIGELGSIYDISKETLTIGQEVEQLSEQV